ncbi:MAG: vWA domain-containing protein [bacterium]
MRARAWSWWSVCLALALPLPSPAVESPAHGAGGDLVFILDASGSMWGQVNREAKIAVARRVLKQVLASVPADTAVGLVAYGHRSKEDCADIELIAAPGTLSRAALAEKVEGLQPKGKTPITAAVTKVFDQLRGRERPTSVVLVSDGLETCGGDPCAAVRAARESGARFVLHVVGFDVGAVEVAQLECMAQAGGGLYLPAANADQLAAALNQAVAMTPETPVGRLIVTVRADGKPADGLVEVVDAASGAAVAQGRTYTGRESNPRIFPLPDGTYDATVEAVTIRGRPSQRLGGIVIAAGKTVERTVEFGSGELRVGVTRNGKLSDAVVTAYRAGSTEIVANTRTYTSKEHNPTRLRVPAGTYDIVVASVEVAGKPSTRWDGVVLEDGGAVERQHDFGSGIVRIGVRRGADLVDAVVSLRPPGEKSVVAQGRTYVSPTSNPKAFDVPPGRYTVSVKPVKPPGLAPRELEIEVAAGGTVEQIVNYE